jgi:hypothetical protein
MEIIPQRNVLGAFALVQERLDVLEEPGLEPTTLKGSA